MRKEKELLLEEIQGQLDRKMFIITRYQGIKPNMANEFRTELSRIGAELEVVPKRLLVKAAVQLGINLDLKELSGHIALVATDKDPVDVTKSIFKFKRNNDGKLDVLGGKFEGKMIPAEQVQLISSLPGMPELRAQLLSVFEAPMAQTLAVINALLCSVPHCLEQKAKQE